MKKRNDATYVGDLPPYKRIFPFIMPRRSDSLVYHQFPLDMTEAVKFVKHMNKNDPGDHQYRVFEVFLAAMLRTITLRPHLNRFIMNYSTWQRSELSLNFVVKEDYTDEAPERSAVLYFEPTMIFPEIAAIVNDTITRSRSGSEDNQTDSAIEFFLRFPIWILRLLVSFIRFLDVKGVAPKALRDADGLHVTAFVANLGSINLAGSPHHHLYEWGTTSIFVTMGMLRRRRVTDANGERTIVDSMDIGVTVDERISEGFYFIKSMEMLQHYLNKPQLLMERPVVPPSPPPAKEKRGRKKAQRKKKG